MPAEMNKSNQCFHGQHEDCQPCDCQCHQGISNQGSSRSPDLVPMPTLTLIERLWNHRNWLSHEGMCVNSLDDAIALVTAAEAWAKAEREPLTVPFEQQLVRKWAAAAALLALLPDVAQETER